MARTVTDAIEVVEKVLSEWGAPPTGAWGRDSRADAEACVQLAKQFYACSVACYEFSDHEQRNYGWALAGSACLALARTDSREQGRAIAMLLDSKIADLETISLQLHAVASHLAAQEGLADIDVVSYRSTAEAVLAELPRFLHQPNLTWHALAQNLKVFGDKLLAVSIPNTIDSDAQPLAIECLLGLLAGGNSRRLMRLVPRDQRQRIASELSEAARTARVALDMRYLFDRSDLGGALGQSQPADQPSGEEQF